MGAQSGAERKLKTKRSEEVSRRSVQKVRIRRALTARVELGEETEETEVEVRVEPESISKRDRHATGDAEEQVQE